MSDSHSQRVRIAASPRVAGIDPTADAIRARDPATIVIFGASGDLARRKLVPALWQLHQAGYLPDRFAVIGFSRSPMSDTAYRDAMRDALGAPAGDPLLPALFYQAGSNDDANAFATLRERIEQIEKERGLPGNRLYYLSVAPEFFPTIVRQLGNAGLIRAPGEERWSRVIIEKPFGHDLQSARALSAVVRGVLDESQIYRIDHYLGKETVQNILTFRFGNSIFEPLFNREHVAGVQITVAETLGMEGRRGAYYDGAGTLRDMVQNHMLQLLSLVAMDPPAALDPQAIRDEKVKVVRALGPLTRDEVAASTVRGQYRAGTSPLDGKPVKGYLQEEGVAPDSLTETYVALRLQLDSWRWAGVPFLLRSGKRLRKRVSEIAIRFKEPPMRLFRPVLPNEELGGFRPRSNVLVLRIQPDEGMSLSFACKVPGMRIELAEVDMNFLYGDAFKQRSPEAYERLLLDALRGDASLFTRSDEVEYAWRLISSIHQGWAELPPAIEPYDPFGDGPAGATRLGLWRSLEDM